MEKRTPFESIKNIQILDICTALGIKTKKEGSNYSLGEGTHGWILKEKENFVTSFSPGYPQGDPYAFVKSYFKGDLKQANDFFSERFDINFGEKKGNKETVDMKDDFFSYFLQMPGPSKEETEYLKERAIDSTLLSGVIKHGKKGFCVGLYDEKMRFVTAQSRSIKEKIYSIPPGHKSDGVFIDSISEKSEGDVLYIVEGMTDFLTLRQYTPFVIGLRSANVGFSVVEKIYKNFDRVIICHDNDEAGESMKNKLLSICEDFEVFDIKAQNVKDINELAVKSEYGKGILDFISYETIKKKKGLARTHEIMQENIKIRELNGGRLGLDFRLEQLNKCCDGIVPKCVYLVQGLPGSGKSNLCYFIASNLIQEDHTCLWVSTEVQEQEVHRHVIRHILGISPKSVEGFSIFDKRLKCIDKNLFVETKLEYIEQIEEKIELLEKKGKKPRTVFIDFVQCISTTKNLDTLEKKAYVAKRIQKIAQMYDISFFSLSQVTIKEGIVSAKGSTDFNSNSDVIFLIQREKNSEKTTNFSITKNKWGELFVGEIVYNFEKSTVNIRKKEFC